MFKRFDFVRFDLKVFINPIMSYLSVRFGKSLYINRIKRETPIIVSLYSREEKFTDLGMTLYSVFSQTVVPDRVILWLSDEYSLSELPYNITKYIKYGLEIRFVQDINSYTAIFYSLKEFSNCIIVTGKDDTFYPKEWLSKLYHSYLSAQQDIHTHLAHRAYFLENKFMSYNTWEKYINEESSCYDNFLCSKGGVLYPPNCFSNEVFRKDIFLKQVKYNSDVWLWFMALVSDRKVRVVQNHIKTFGYSNLLRYLLKKNYTLFPGNSVQKNIDTQISNLMKLYGQNIYHKL